MIEIDRKESDVARAAWLYYHEELTQSEVARELGVSRSTVTRLLQRAKLEGRVTITLNVTAGLFQAERNLERAFGLARVRLVPASGDDAMQKRWLGRVAAELLAPAVKERSIVAVGWGTTLFALAESLIGRVTTTGVQVVPLVGGLHNAAAGTETNEIAKVIAHYFDAAMRPLLAPIYVQDEATALGLANDPGIRDTLALGRQASLVIFSLGAVQEDTTIFRLGYVTAAQRKFLKRHGAVGDIACRWIDERGYAVTLPPGINPIGISLDDLRRIPRRLVVAGGRSKRAVVLACLRGGYATTLVTDEDTAEYLLQHC